MPLVAVLALIQVCTGLASAFAGASNVPAATTADGCCSERPEPACAAARETAGAVNTCARYCIERQDAVKPDPVLPPSANFSYAGLALIGRSAFPPHAPRLTAAPLAANRTPLIYRFQRLLN